MLPQEVRRLAAYEMPALLGRAAKVRGKCTAAQKIYHADAPRYVIMCVPPRRAFPSRAHT
jgi:hypothetical protein